jgi:Ran GTPase-activating protein (RanGAP) involved in mRNA processing and transport
MVVLSAEAAPSSSIHIKTQQALNQGLEHLSLADSFFSNEDDGCAAVADALKSGSFKSLDLRGCNVRSRGAKLLANALQFNSRLQQLGLEWNNIGVGEGGVKSLCQALEGNKALQILDLRNNAIQEADAKAVASLIRKNSCLRSLDLR